LHYPTACSAYCQVSRLPIFIGLGPLFAGILSDLYIPHPGDESLRWSMISVLMVNVPGIVFSMKWLSATLTSPWPAQLLPCLL